MSSTNSTGQYGGLLTTWNPKKGFFSPYRTMAKTLIMGDFTGFCTKLHIRNCYGTYGDIYQFWDQIQKDNFLKLPFLILGGDINFTVGIVEVWVEKSCLDPMGDFFIHSFEKEGMVDITQGPMRPMWINQRDGIEATGKHLGHFLIAK